MKTETKVYLAIYRYLDEHNGQSPSMREIRALSGLGSTNTVSFHVNELAKRGLVLYEGDRSARSISLPGSTYANPLPPREIIEDLLAAEGWID